MTEEHEYAIQAKKLGRLVYKKRQTENLTLVEVSKATGVSPATLSRVERQREKEKVVFTPATRTVTALTRWLGIPITAILDTHSTEDYTSQTLQDHLEAVRAHLRTSKKLDAKSAELLGSIFGLAYEQMSAQTDDEHVQETQATNESAQ